LLFCCSLLLLLLLLLPLSFCIFPTVTRIALAARRLLSSLANAASASGVFRFKALLIRTFHNTEKAAVAATV